MPPRPLPSIAGTVRAAVIGITPSNQPWTNVHHLRYAGGASAPGSTEIAAADALLARLYTGAVFGSGQTWLYNCYSVLRILRIDYTLLDGSSMGYSYAHDAPGLRTASLPSECSPVLTLLTGRRGRRYRGRLFMPTPDPSTIGTTGQLQQATATAIQLQYAGMMAALAAIQWAPVVASYGIGSYKGQPTSWAPFATDITSTKMDLTMDVQRRRK